MPDEEEKPLVSVFGRITDLILSTLFFLFMWLFVLKPHVPSEDPIVVNYIAAMTALCMTGVFWLAVNMFRVTRVDFQRRKKKGLNSF
jgi:hypothetical protein